MISVCIVNGSRLVGSVMAAALSDHPDFRVMGTATDIRRTLQLFSTEKPHVLLVSPNLQNDEAIDLIQILKEKKLIKTTKVLVVGMPDNPDLLMRYFQAGVAGYVLRTDTVNVLVDNIRAAHEGRALVSPEMAAAMMAEISELADDLPPPGSDLERLDELTSREKEVLHLIGEGLRNRQIAERLTIELGTVKNHVHSILEKLDAVNRQAAADYWEKHQDELTVPDTTAGRAQASRKSTE